MHVSAASDDVGSDDDDSDDEDGDEEGLAASKVSSKAPVATAVAAEGGDVSLESSVEGPSISLTSSPTLSQQLSLFGGSPKPKNMSPGGGGWGATKMRRSSVSAFVAAGKAFRWRKAQMVHEVLDKWWKMIENLLRQRGHRGDPSTWSLTWDDYFFVFRKVYRCMVAEYDPNEAYEACREDWDADTRGAETLSAERVHDAIFELADVWTTGTTPAECATFLHELLAKISRVGAKGD